MSTDNNSAIKLSAEEIARQAAALVQLADTNGSPAAQLSCKTAIQKQLNLVDASIRANIEAEGNALHTAQSEDSATPRGPRDHGFVTTEVLPANYGGTVYPAALPPGYQRPRY